MPNELAPSNPFTDPEPDDRRRRNSGAHRNGPGENLKRLDYDIDILNWSNNGPEMLDGPK
jgi:hypothetical protein